MVTQFLSFLGYALQQQEDKENNAVQELLLSFRNIDFISDWTRVMVHAMFLNSMEESMYLAEGSPSEEEADVEAVPFMSTALVHANNIKV